jgi:sulfatase maturation enzyme AslB (radical SAM superfamily)
MEFTLKDDCYLKRLEEPHIYDAAADELYMLDEDSFSRVLALSGGAEDLEASGLLKEAGLLQEGPRRIPVFTEGRSADPSLRYLEIQITGRCDKVCRHCYLGGPADKDMELETFASIMKEFSEIQGLKVMVSGGEPACHPLFQDIMRMLPELPVRSVLITHGEWIGLEEAGWLGQSFHQVQVSLDGMEPGHDLLRGKGSFARAAAGIQALTGADETWTSSRRCRDFYRSWKSRSGLSTCPARRDDGPLKKRIAEN